LGRKPDDGVKSIKVQQDDTRSAEPNLNLNQQEDDLNPIDLSSSVVQTKPSRPNLKDRLNPKHQKPVTPANIPSKTNDHSSHSEDEEDLFPPAKTHSDNVASEPKDSYDDNSNTAPKTDEDTVSSTLFPPFSKRVRTTTPTPAVDVDPLPSIKAGNESASPFGQSRITSYKQRIEAMKEKARQKEQQAQPKQKQEPEIIEEVQEVSSTTTSTTVRPSTTRPKTPPRMPTRKPLFSSTTTTTAAPSIPEEDYPVPVEQSTRRFKPKFSKPSDATEPLSALNENQPEQPPTVSEQVDESSQSREIINTPKEGDFKNINVRLRGKHRLTGNMGSTSTTIQPDLLNEKNPSDVFPQLAVDTSVDKQEDGKEDGKEDGSESIDISSHQPSSEGRENTESEDHHHSAHHHHEYPAELRATLSHVVPLSPDLSDPVSKARKQFFAATHDPMLPIEELLNIRVRDNGKGM